MIELATKIKQKKISWLWPGWIPRGKLTVLDGDPGMGKSTITADIAARVTHGAGSPCGTCRVSKGRVLISSAEDDPGDTTIPRLIAATADLEKIDFWSEIIDKAGSRPIELPTDLPFLTSRYALWIIDPIVAFLSGRIDACRDQEIRRGLHQLAGIAAEKGMAVLMVRHLNKSSGTKAIYRGGGSIGIVGAARSGLIVTSDSENRRHLAVAKSNLAAIPMALRYRLVPEGDVCTVAWEGPVDLKADDLLAADVERRAAPVRAACVDDLRSLLAEHNGSIRAEDASIVLTTNGHSHATIQRARQELGICSRKNGDGWIWTIN